MAESNPNQEIQFAKLINTEADRNSFAFEDLMLTGNSDRDFNDVIFQLQGAVGQVSLIDDVIDPSRDWRNSELGQDLLDYIDLENNGLTARYYDNDNFTNYRGRRREGVIDYDWALGSPRVVTSTDSFSISWVGQVKPIYSEEYTFYTRADDRVRLWIGNELLVDQWFDRPLTENSATIQLEAGRKYDIRLEYADGQDDASVQLLWSSDSQPREIVRQNLLYPDPNSPPIDPETGLEYYPGDLLIKFEESMSDTSISDFSTDYGAKSTEKLIPVLSKTTSRLSKWNVLSFGQDQDLHDILEQVKQDSRVEAAGFDYFMEPTRSIPSDPQFNNLWGLDNQGNHDIDAPEAWDITKGNRDIIVGVIDSGIDYNHPDLAANIWNNLDEIPANGIDDDGNGYVDDFIGYDVANNDADPMDTNGHGTHVAGTIGAVGRFSDNMSQGIIGVSPFVSLMPIKHKDTEGLFKGNRLRHSTEAIHYAVSNGARIINASWGFERNFWTDQVAGFFKKVFGAGTSFEAATDAIRFANDAEVLFVTSAGNDSENLDSTGRWPNSLGLSNVITVAATDRNDNLAIFSNNGVETVDLGAPGENILSTLPGNTYGYKSGTSMAAPHVAGTAALLLSQDPFLTAAELRQLLMRGADPIPALSGKTVIGGRLNAYNSLLQLEPTRRVALTINELRDVGILDPKPLIFNKSRRFGDFYATVSINDDSFEPTENTSDTQNPRPNWRFLKDVTQDVINISIAIHDKDGGPLRPFDGDDTGDINPSSEAKTLDLNYDTLTGEITNLANGTKHLPQPDGRFFFTGDHKDDQVDIYFTLEKSWV